MAPGTAGIRVIQHGSPSTFHPLPVLRSVPDSVLQAERINFSDDGPASQGPPTKAPRPTSTSHDEGPQRPSPPTISAGPPPRATTPLRELVATLGSIQEAILQLRSDQASVTQAMQDIKIGMENTLDNFEFRIGTIDVEQSHARNAAQASSSRLERVEDSVSMILQHQEALARMVAKLQGTEADLLDPAESPPSRWAGTPAEPTAPRSAFSASELTRGSSSHTQSAAPSSPYRFELNSAAKHRAARSSLDPATATGPQIQALQAQAALEQLHPSALTSRRHKIADQLAAAELNILANLKPKITRATVNKLPELLATLQRIWKYHHHCARHQIDPIPLILCSDTEIQAMVQGSRLKLMGSSTALTAVNPAAFMASFNPLTSPANLEEDTTADISDEDFVAILVDRYIPATSIPLLKTLLVHDGMRLTTYRHLATRTQYLNDVANYVEATLTSLSSARKILAMLPTSRPTMLNTTVDLKRELTISVEDALDAFIRGLQPFALQYQLMREPEVANFLAKYRQEPSTRQHETHVGQTIVIAASTYMQSLDMALPLLTTSDEFMRQIAHASDKTPRGQPVAPTPTTSNREMYSHIKRSRELLLPHYRADRSTIPASLATLLDTFKMNAERFGVNIHKDSSSSKDHRPRHPQDGGRPESRDQRPRDRSNSRDKASPGRRGSHRTPDRPSQSRSPSPQRSAPSTGYQKGRYPSSPQSGNTIPYHGNSFMPRSRSPTPERQDRKPYADTRAATRPTVATSPQSHPRGSRERTTRPPSRDDQKRPRTPSPGRSPMGKAATPPRKSPPATGATPPKARGTPDRPGPPPRRSMSAISVYAIQDEIDNLDHAADDPWSDDSSAQSEDQTASDGTAPTGEEEIDTESDRYSDDSHDSIIFSLTTRIEAPDAHTVRLKYARWRDELRTRFPPEVAPEDDNHGFPEVDDDWIGPPTREGPIQPPDPYIVLAFSAPSDTKSLTQEETATRGPEYYHHLDGKWTLHHARLDNRSPVSLISWHGLCQVAHTPVPIYLLSEDMKVTLPQGGSADIRLLVKLHIMPYPAPSIDVTAEEHTFLIVDTLPGEILLGRGKSCISTTIYPTFKRRTHANNVNRGQHDPARFEAEILASASNKSRDGQERKRAMVGHDHGVNMPVMDLLFWREMSRPYSVAREFALTNPTSVTLTNALGKELWSYGIVFICILPIWEVDAEDHILPPLTTPAILMFGLKATSGCDVLIPTSSATRMGVATTTVPIRYMPTPAEGQTPPLARAIFNDYLAQNVGIGAGLEQHQSLAIVYDRHAEGMYPYRSVHNNVDATNAPTQVPRHGNYPVPGIPPGPTPWPPLAPVRRPLIPGESYLRHTAQQNPSLPSRTAVFSPLGANARPSLVNRKALRYIVPPSQPPDPDATNWRKLWTQAAPEVLWTEAHPEYDNSLPTPEESESSEQAEDDTEEDRQDEHDTAPSLQPTSSSSESNTEPESSTFSDKSSTVPDSSTESSKVLMYSPSMEPQADQEPDHADFEQDDRPFGDSPDESEDQTRPTGIGRMGQLKTPTPPIYRHEVVQITPMQPSTIQGPFSAESNAPRSPSVRTTTDEQPHPRQLVPDGDPTSSFSTPDSIPVPPRRSLPRASKEKPIERFHPNLVGEQHLRDPNRAKRSTPPSQTKKAEEDKPRLSSIVIDLTMQAGIEHLRRLQELEALRVAPTPGTKGRLPKNYRGTPRIHALGYSPEVIEATLTDRRVRPRNGRSQLTTAPRHDQLQTMPEEPAAALSPAQILEQDIEEHVRRTKELRESFTRPNSPLTPEELLEKEYAWQHEPCRTTWILDESDTPIEIPYEPPGYNPDPLYQLDYEEHGPQNPEDRYKLYELYEEHGPHNQDDTGTHAKSSQNKDQVEQTPHVEQPAPQSTPAMELTIPLDSRHHPRRQKIRQDIEPPTRASQQPSPMDLQKLAEESAELERKRQAAADRAERLAIRNAIAESQAEMEQDQEPEKKPRRQRAKKAKKDAPPPSTPPPLATPPQQGHTPRGSTSTPRPITAYFPPSGNSVRSTIAASARRSALAIQAADLQDQASPPTQLWIYTPSGGHGSDQITAEGNFIPRSSQERSVRRKSKARKEPDQTTTKLAAISMTKSPRQQPKLKPVATIPDSQAKFVDYKMPSLLALGQIQVTIDEGQPMITVEAGRDAMAATNCINEKLANSQEFKHVPRHQHTMILELADKTRRKVTQFITILLVVSLPGERKKRLQQISLMIVPDLMYDVLLSAETCVASSLLRRWLELFRVDVQTLKETSEYIIERASIHPLYADADPHSSDQPRKETTPLRKEIPHQIPTDRSQYTPPDNADTKPQESGVVQDTRGDKKSKLPKQRHQSKRPDKADTMTPRSAKPRTRRQPQLSKQKDSLEAPQQAKDTHSTTAQASRS